MTQIFKSLSFWKIVLALEILIGSYFSIGYHQWDEYFQITEFTAYKLGITPPENLAWEYQSKIRPWIHPSINVAIVKLCEKLKVTNRFFQAFLFRFFAGLLAYLSVLYFLYVLKNFRTDPDDRRNILILFSCTAFLPYLMVRASSEMLSASFLLLGLSSMINLGILPNSAKTTRPYFSASLFITGLFFGFAFDFRYQVGVIAFSTCLWLILFLPTFTQKLLAFFFFSGGVLAAIALGLLIDAWGYGEWVLTPWNYFESNLIKGVAASMGTKPFYSYFYLSANGPLAPLILFLIIINVLFWIRFPRHLMTWITLPFFLLHSVISHKEGRFLYPLVYFSLINFYLFFNPENDSASRIESKWRQFSLGVRRLFSSKWLLPFFVINFVGLVFLLFSPIKEEIRFQKYIYNHLPHQTTLYLYGSNPYFSNFFQLEHRFNRPSDLKIISIKDQSQVKTFSLDQIFETKYLILESTLLDDKLLSDIKKSKSIKVLYLSYPEWLLKLNYFNWVDRTRFWVLYELSPLKLKS